MIGVGRATISCARRRLRGQICGAPTRQAQTDFAATIQLPLHTAILIGVIASLVLYYAGVGLFAEVARIDEVWSRAEGSTNAVVVLSMRMLPEDHAVSLGREWIASRC